MTTGEMNHRERLFAALNHEETDRIPWSPCVCQYWTFSLKGELHGDDIAAQRYIDCDMMLRHVPSYKGQIVPRGLAFDSLHPQYEDRDYEVGEITVRERWDRGELLRIFETPYGTLQERLRRSDASPWLGFPVEHIVKTRDDMRILQYMYESQIPEPDYGTFLEIDRFIGEDGIATPSSPSSPLMYLLQIDFGVENFFFLWADHPQEMEELFESLHQKYLEICRIQAGLPGKRVIISYENADTMFTPPKMFAEVSLPHLNAYADILHDGDKIHLLHACGHLRGIVQELKSAHFDGVVDMASEPTGNLHLADAKAVWGSDKVAMGGIDAVAFTEMSPEEMKAHALEWCERIAPYRGVILGSGDAVPFTASLENMMAVTEAVKEFTL